MEVGNVQSTATGMPDKQKELDAKVRAVKSSVTVSIIKLFSVVFVVMQMLKIRLDKMTNKSKIGVFKSTNQGLPEHRKYLVPKL